MPDPLAEIDLHARHVLIARILHIQIPETDLRPVIPKRAMPLLYPRGQGSFVGRSAAVIGGVRR